jgi:hypothetical protein
MILFVDDNSGILFLKRLDLVLVWITEIIERVSRITTVLNMKSRINGD